MSAEVFISYASEDRLRILDLVGRAPSQSRCFRLDLLKCMQLWVNMMKR